MDGLTDEQILAMAALWLPPGYKCETLAFARALLAAPRQPREVGADPHDHIATWLHSPDEDASAQQDEPTPARPISDAMMDLVDRLGSESANVDPRAWQHLLAYAPKAAQQDEREADLLVKLDDAKRALHFWKTQYQTLANVQQVQADAGAVDIKALVNRFLTWPVPASVYPDGVPGQPGRTGTNLLSALEAEEMLRYVLQGAHPSPAAESDKRDAERYRFIKANNLILSGGSKFHWPISPFGEQCDRYVDAAMRYVAAAMSRTGTTSKGETNA